MGSAGGGAGPWGATGGESRRPDALEPDALEADRTTLALSPMGPGALASRRRDTMLRVCRGLVLLTWGFGVWAYGRQQSVEGFDTWALCEGVRVQMMLDRPDWILGPCRVES